MAQVVQIPVSFQFSITRVEWVNARARFIGWSKRDDSTADGKDLIAEVETASGTKSLELPLGVLPEAEEQLCIEAFAESEDDEDVEKICSSFEPHLLVASRGSGDYPKTNRMPSKPTADAWVMRNDFLRIGDTTESAIAFLNKWGCWNDRTCVSLHELVRSRKAVAEALVSVPEKWFSGQSALGFIWQRSSSYPFFALHTDQCECAIRMTVTIDLLHGVKFKICARPDCRRPFPVRSKHRQKYCEQYCGHLESVRRNRKLTRVQVGNRKRRR
jgi:hypothetical protein